MPPEIESSEPSLNRLVIAAGIAEAGVSLEVEPVWLKYHPYLGNGRGRCLTCLQPLDFHLHAEPYGYR